MPTTHYAMHVTSNGSDARYVISYRNNKFYRLEHKSGSLTNQTFYDKLMMIVPEYEKDITVMILKYDDGRITYEKKGGTSTLEKSLYSQMVETYMSFYEKRSPGVAARFGATEGRIIKEVMTYFKKSCATDKEVIDQWNSIFNNWHKLSDFHAAQIELKQINSNLNTILRQIKANSNDKERTSEGQSFGAL